MTDGAPVSVSRRIQASPEAIFAVLVDPRLHPEIDGSGMVRAAVTPAKISKLGDEFFMSMHNEEMGDYEMLNRVVEFEPDRRIGWEPALSRASRPEDEDAVGDFAHHVWAYDLVQDGAGGTLVTETYDCSRAPAWLRKAVREGQRWAESMTRSLENLDRLVRS